MTRAWKRDSVFQTAVGPKIGSPHVRSRSRIRRSLSRMLFGRLSFRNGLVRGPTDSRTWSAHGHRGEKQLLIRPQMTVATLVTVIFLVTVTFLLGAFVPPSGAQVITDSAPVRIVAPQHYVWNNAIMGGAGPQGSDRDTQELRLQGSCVAGRRGQSALRFPAPRRRGGLRVRRPAGAQEFNLKLPDCVLRTGMVDSHRVVRQDSGLHGLWRGG